MRRVLLLAAGVLIGIALTRVPSLWSNPNSFDARYFHTPDGDFLIVPGGQAIAAFPTEEFLDRAFGGETRADEIFYACARGLIRPEPDGPFVEAFIHPPFALIGRWEPVIRVGGSSWEEVPCALYSPARKSKVVIVLRLGDSPAWIIEGPPEPFARVPVYDQDRLRITGWDPP